MKEYSFIKPDPTLRNNLMAFGYECGEGWHGLIEELFDEIQYLLDNKYPELKDEFRVTQVKEKWGSLRVYVIGANNYILDLIDKYELISSHICERCSKYGTIRERTGWFTCLCVECANEK